MQSKVRIHLNKSIMGEYDAVNIYQEVLDNLPDTLDPDKRAVAEKIIKSIQDEERKHIGELNELYRLLDDNEQKLFEAGQQEVTDMVDNKSDNTGEESFNVPFTLGRN